MSSEDCRPCLWTGVMRHLTLEWTGWITFTCPDEFSISSRSVADSHGHMLINMIIKHLPEQQSLSSLFLVKKRIWGEGPEEFPAFPIPDAGNSFPSLGAPRTSTDSHFRLVLTSGRVF